MIITNKQIQEVNHINRKEDKSTERFSIILKHSVSKKGLLTGLQVPAVIPSPLNYQRNVKTLLLFPM